MKSNTPEKGEEGVANLFEDEYGTEDHKEKDFVNVVPEFGTCGPSSDPLTPDTVQIDSSTKPTPKMNQPSLTSSDLPAHTSKKASKLRAYVDAQLTEEQRKFQEKLGLNGGDLSAEDLRGLVKAGKVCFKCKQRPPNYANKQDKVCKGCFMESIVHRIKSSLRLNLKIWKDDLNLICISGGSSSMALLELMHEALFGASITQRKLFFRVHVLYIDEGRAVYDWSPEFHK